MRGAGQRGGAGAEWAGRGGGKRGVQRRARGTRKSSGGADHVTNTNVRGSLRAAFERGTWVHVVMGSDGVGWGRRAAGRGVETAVGSVGSAHVRCGAVQ